MNRPLPEGVRRSVGWVPDTEAVAVRGPWDGSKQEWWDRLEPSERPYLRYFGERGGQDSLAFLRDLDGLWGLDLAENVVADQTVERLTTLTHLMLDQMSARTFDASGLTNLRDLTAGQHPLKGLANLPRLESLTLSTLQVRRRNLDLLLDLPSPASLRSLCISSTNAEEVEAVGAFSNLEFLRLGGCKDVRLSNIQRLSRLHRLEIWYRPEVDVGEWSEALPLLRWVWLQWVKRVKSLASFDARPEVTWYWDPGTGGVFEQGEPSWWSARWWNVDPRSGIPRIGRPPVET